MKLILHARKDLGGAHEDGHMVIVATGVHHPHLLAVVVSAHLRGEGKIHGLRHRQAVHIRPQSHHGAWTAAKDPHHAGHGYVRFHLQTEAPKMLGDERGGSKLPVPELRMGVEVPAPAHHLRHDRFDLGAHRRRHRVVGNHGQVIGKARGRNGSQGGRQKAGTKGVA